MASFSKFTSLLFLFFLLLYGQVLCQTGNHLTCERVFEVRSTTTVVVLDDYDSPYNEIMRRAMHRYWKITPIEFTTESKKFMFLGSRDYTILMKNQAVRVEKRVKGEFKIQFNEIGLYPGYRALDKQDLHARDAYAKIRVDSLHKTETYLYKLEGLIHAMHDYLVYAAQGNIRRNTYEKDMKTYLNRSSSELASKTLYVTYQDVPKEEQHLVDAYQHPFTFIEKADLQSKIAQEDSAAAFLHIHPLVSQIYVIDIPTGRILYGGKTIRYKTLSKEDFRNLSQVARKKEKGWKKFFR